MTQPGYKIGRDEWGLTLREREVLALLVQSKNLVEIGEALGVSKQRARQIIDVLIEKGSVRQEDDAFVIVVRR